MFWIVIWVSALIIFILIPILCSEKRRNICWNLIRHCRWNVEDPDEQRSGADNNNDQYHYALSATMEEEIRHGFILDKLNLYTKTLEDDGFRTRSDSTTTVSLSSGDENSSSGEVGTVEVATTTSTGISAEDNATMTGDIEAPPLPPPSAPADTSKPSDDYNSDDECMAVGEIDIADFDGEINVPVAGEQCRLDHDALQAERQVPNGCAICLCHFEKEDKVTWSSNPSCNHVFHHGCVTEWLMESGARHLRRQRRDSQRRGIINYAVDPVLKLTKFPMLCPCCRQPFVVDLPTKDDLLSETEYDANNDGISSSDNTTDLPATQNPSGPSTPNDLVLVEA